MKKLFLFLITLFLIVLCSCNSNKTDKLKLCIKDYDQNIIETSVDCNLDKYLAYDNTIYHKDLASFLSMLALSTNNEVKLSNMKTYGNTMELLTYLECSDVTYIDLNDDTYVYDQNDVTKFVLAKKHVDNKDLVILVIEPTDGTSKQWSSNCDVGTDNELYNEYHPLYKNKANHKGFEVTKNRVIAYLYQYIEKIDNPYLFITGHSRGSAIANLIGYDIENKYKSFIYTFACPNTTTLEHKINNIFNIVNINDTVTYLPFESIGFKRFGTDIIFEPSDNIKFFNKILNRQYAGKLEVEALNILSKNLTCKDDIYTFDEVNIKEYASFSDDVSKEDELNTLNSLLDKFEVKDFSKIIIDDNKIYLKICYGYVLRLACNLLDSPSVILYAFKIVPDYYVKLLFDVYKNVDINEIADGHQMITYYIYTLL